ncbi:deoxyguanosinetriphosphate triphosphohydrolase [Microvirga sp. W0021]|uniref:Deoxyguanosinetriphosphate triphosphohydrolase-like protein n=1 Tax=Hohaiivirga grylli TaxID=3133970 RepID=A0ABV0BK03_9HYPH
MCQEEKRVKSFGERWRAPYACDPANSRGRLFPTDTSPTRSEFQRDRDRIIHSSAFRRLKHKTQVFVYHEGDHYRTRLTHTIEVAQISRAIARSLGLDEDLAEALALSHDLGHTPFGHSGEDALNRCLKSYGGFDHNAQALSIVTRLENHYAEHDGLNLTWETLEGLVKHNGPLLNKDGTPTERYKVSGIPQLILDYNKQQDLWLDTYASGEAQAAAIADDIAYNTHDIDDGLRAGLFELDELREIPLLNALLDEIDSRYPDLSTERRGHELTRRLITRFVEDVVRESDLNLAALNPKSADDIRHASKTQVTFSAEMHAADQAIKGFLYPHMYRHERVMSVRKDAENIVESLFRHYMEHEGDMPEEWQVQTQDMPQKALQVANYIAGMTDRYAILAYQRLFGSVPSLR